MNIVHWINRTIKKERQGNSASGPSNLTLRRLSIWITRQWSILDVNFEIITFNNLQIHSLWWGHFSFRKAYGNSKFTIKCVRSDLRKYSNFEKYISKVVMLHEWNHGLDILNMICWYTLLRQVIICLFSFYFKSFI